MRCFVSLDLPEEVKNSLSVFQDKVRKINAFRGKFVEKENLHLTLKFLGEITKEKAEEVSKKLSEVKIKPSECIIDGAGVFSREFIRIVWARVRGAEKIQGSVDSALSELFEPERRFMGHITLARAKSVFEKERLIKVLDEASLNVVFKAKSFSLMKSVLGQHGAVYEVLRKYEL